MSARFLEMLGRCILFGLIVLVWMRTDIFLAIAIPAFLGWIWIEHAIATRRTRARERIRELVRNRICVHCGYDLRATPVRCPECGTVVPSGFESDA